MKNKLVGLALTALFYGHSITEAGDYKFPYLFEHPRDGKFKVTPWNQDCWDKTSLGHYYGSAGLSASLNFYFDKKDSKKPVLKSTLITLGLGALKETEDGFREGFGGKDLIANALGTISGILIYQGGKWVIKKI